MGKCRNINFYKFLAPDYHHKLVLGIPLYATSCNVFGKGTTCGITDSPDITKDSFVKDNTTYYYNGTKTITNKNLLTLNSDICGVMYWEISTLNHSDKLLEVI